MAADNTPACSRPNSALAVVPANVAPKQPVPINVHRHAGPVATDPAGIFGTAGTHPAAKRQRIIVLPVLPPCGSFEHLSADEVQQVSQRLTDKRLRRLQVPSRFCLPELPASLNPPSEALRSGPAPSVDGVLASLQPFTRTYSRPALAGGAHGTLRRILTHFSIPMLSEQHCGKPSPFSRREAEQSRSQSGERVGLFCPFFAGATGGSARRIRL
jgi:hypothetical protein